MNRRPHKRACQTARATPRRAPRAPNQRSSIAALMMHTLHMKTTRIQISREMVSESTAMDDTRGIPGGAGHAEAHAARPARAPLPWGHVQAAGGGGATRDPSDTATEHHTNDPVEHPSPRHAHESTRRHRRRRKRRHRRRFSHGCLRVLRWDRDPRICPYLVSLQGGGFVRALERAPTRVAARDRRQRKDGRAATATASARARRPHPEGPAYSWT